MHDTAHDEWSELSAWVAAHHRAEGRAEIASSLERIRFDDMPAIKSWCDQYSERCFTQWIERYHFSITTDSYPMYPIGIGTYNR